MTVKMSWLQFTCSGAPGGVCGSWVGWYIGRGVCHLKALVDGLALSWWLSAGGDAASIRRLAVSADTLAVEAGGRG